MCSDTLATEKNNSTCFFSIRLCMVAKMDSSENPKYHRSHPGRYSVSCCLLEEPSIELAEFGVVYFWWMQEENSVYHKLEHTIITILILLVF